MSTQAILEREKRWRPWVVAASIVPVPIFFLAQNLQVASLADETLPGSLARYNEQSGNAVLGAVLAALAYLIALGPFVYLFRAARARSEQVSAALLPVLVLGPVVFGSQVVLGALAQIDIADQFETQRSGVGDIYTLATNLSEDSGLGNVARAMTLIWGLALVIGIVYTCLWGFRTGLLTRFHGTLGMALGAALILLPGFALLGVLIWLVFFGLSIAGRTAKGRPPAWDAGVAVPWPPPGEEQVIPAGAGAGAGVIKGDASEIPGVGESSNAARRERAKKRKRKRRR